MNITAANILQDTRCGKYEREECTLSHTTGQEHAVEQQRRPYPGALDMKIYY